MKLSDITAYLNKLAKNGDILSWSVKDLGNKLIYNIVFDIDGERYDSRNYTVLVLDRGTENERAYWARDKPRPMRVVQTQAQQKYDSLKDLIVKDLKTNHNVIIITNTMVNKDKNYAIITGYITNQDNTVSKQDFLVTIDTTNSTYNIYPIK